MIVDILFEQIGGRTVLVGIVDEHGEVVEHAGVWREPDDQHKILRLNVRPRRHALAATQKPTAATVALRKRILARMAEDGALAQDIIEMTGKSMATVYEHLGVLLKLEWIERDGETFRYSLTPEGRKQLD